MTKLPIKSLDRNFNLSSHQLKKITRMLQKKRRCGLTNIKKKITGLLCNAIHLKSIYANLKRIILP